jgi:solute carrier family 35 protein F5
MLLTSPLIVTVGMSLSIPLSLVGQMIINSQNSGVIYWIGAGIVFLSFIFINYETKDEETTPPPVEVVDVEGLDNENMENQNLSR